MPLCFSRLGSCLTTKIPKSEKCAPDVHTFWPFMIHLSPSCTALLLNPATSDPADGSEKS